MLRGIFRRRRLRKDASGIHTRFLPLGDIRSMAVVVDGAGLRVDECVEMIEKFCKSRGMSLRLMYVDLRKFNSKFQPMTDVDKTILRKNLNWFGRPNLHKVSQITTEPADLYLCLYDSDIYCIRYISCAVKAKFKVGLRDFPDDPYNFVVSPPQDLAEDGVPAPTDVESVFVKIMDLIGSVR